MTPNECTQCGGVEWEPLMKMSLGEDADMWECQGCLAIVAVREYLNEGNEYAK